MAKRTPKNIRGMIFAVIGVMAALGSIVYLQLYALLIKFYYFPAWAFATIGLIDTFMVLFLFLMIFLGKFGDPAAATDEE